MIVRCQFDKDGLSDEDTAELLSLRDPWIEIGGDPVLGPNPPVYVHPGECSRLSIKYKVIASGTIGELKERRQQGEFNLN